MVWKMPLFLFGTQMSIKWILLFVLIPFISSYNDSELELRTMRLMKQSPLIDGHNDFALQIRRLYQNKLSRINLRILNSTRTNIKKLKDGYVGAQFWSAYVLCSSQDKDAVRLALEQIDVIKRMCNEYDELELVTSSEGIVNTSKLACLIGVEGGHAIDSSLGTLRMFYDLGVRYMGLTHTCNTPWAETSSYGVHSSYQDTKSLTDFGKKKNKGLVMVNFHTQFVACQKTANISDVADHFDYISSIAGFQSVGIGGDYDGVNGFPRGLEDPSKYPSLIQELLRRGWKDNELEGVLRANFLRVFREVEKVRDEQIYMKPSEEEISADELNYSCRLDLRSFEPKNLQKSGGQEKGRSMIDLILSIWIIFFANMFV
ncbi:hypothetical protein XENTR_v10011342 [Xenopus tropicalis]|nr:hypothetical protein XENTR_v10011342 [Xenopus tropicalis]